jgi:hypothetical protein
MRTMEDNGSAARGTEDRFPVRQEGMVSEPSGLGFYLSKALLIVARSLLEDSPILLQVARVASHWPANDARDENSG